MAEQEKQESIERELPNISRLANQVDDLGELLWQIADLLGLSAEQIVPGAQEEERPLPATYVIEAQIRIGDVSSRLDRCREIVCILRDQVAVMRLMLS